MVEKTRCETCDRTFKDMDSLVAHNKAKHPESVKKPKKHLPIKNLIIILTIIGFIVISSLYYFSKDDCLTTTADKMDIKGHKNLALHIHPELQIIINKENKTIPMNIGLIRDIMRPIHTHKTDNILHIEAPCQRNFKLEEFFKVWGETFNKNCIFEYCADKGELKMYINEKENTEFENYIMGDKDKILIEYVSKEN